MLEIDVINAEHMSAATTAMEENWSRLDSILRTIAFAPANGSDGGYHVGGA